MVTNRQIAFIVFGIMGGFGSIILPKIIAEEGGTGGWFILLVRCILTLIVVIIITYLGLLNKNATVIEYSKTLIGKKLSFLVLSIYVIFLFVIFSMTNRLSCETIKFNMLAKTPLSILLLIFIIPTYYAVSKGLSTISRLCELYGLIILVLGFIVQLIIFTQGNLINLRPYFVPQDLPYYLKGISKCGLLASGVSILSLIPFGEKQNKKTFSYISIIIAIICALYIIQFESSISIMGIDSLIMFDDSLFNSIRRVDVPYLQFLRRLDGIFILVSILSFFLNLTLYAYGIVTILSKLFKSIPSNTILRVVLILSFFISYYPKDFKIVKYIFLTVTNINFIVILTINLIFIFIMKVKKNA